jgi:mediator of RNA polymerase II transcription subunit 7
MDDAEAAERNQALKNPFPKPPSHWTLYTNDNLRLLELLKRRLQETQPEEDIADAPLHVDQVALLHDEPSLLSFQLLDLEPPRLDWIYEKGEYTTFGETHSVSQLDQIRSRRPIDRDTKTADQTTPYPSDIKRFAELGGQSG